MLGAFRCCTDQGWNWPWLIALPVGVIGVALASLVLEWLVFRWFYQRMFEHDRPARPQHDDDVRRGADLGCA
jgi:branched-subunit amino acid ABC-type transport system permease component